MKLDLSISWFIFGLCLFTNIWWSWISDDGSGKIVCKQLNDPEFQKLFFDDYDFYDPYCVPVLVEETDAFDELGELKTSKSVEVALTEQEDNFPSR